MKDYVVGSPYATETEICDVDELLIVACDGVGPFSPILTLDQVLTDAMCTALGRMRRSGSNRARAAPAGCPGNGYETA